MNSSQQLNLSKQVYPSYEKREQNVSKTNAEVLRTIHENRIRQQLEAYTEGDADFFIEFTENILSNFQQIIRTLNAIEKECDQVALGKLIHLVKPTLEIVGEDDLLHFLTDLRKNWEQGRQAKGLVYRIRIHTEAVVQILKKLIKGEQNQMGISDYYE